MNQLSEEREYEFDLAISYASEDRELVNKIVEKLKINDISVFYDTDRQADMWGEDLVEYLDQIYRTKARYAMIFISHFYAEKMWTRHERRSALARALQQKSAYVLPVRLDDTALDGLPPSIGYLDARQIGADGIISATLAKLTGSKPAQPAEITRVPRTEVERQQVLLIRPEGWEFLYFAAQLLHERDSIDDKYQDHEIHYASPTREVVRREDMSSYIKLWSNDASILSGKMTSLVSNREAQERAFGALGEPGDPYKLAHLAKRWNSTYEEFMDWAARLRGSSVPSDFHHLIELLARFADGPVEQYRKFVDEFVSTVDALPTALATPGEPIRIEMTLTIFIPDDIVQEYSAEFDRLVSEGK